MKFRKYSPSKKAKHEFAEKMKKIEEFCAEHGIDRSRSGDSYYFTVNGQKYRVSNHSVEASNAAAMTETGEFMRDKYHPVGRETDIRYIHAGKTRLMEIYTNLVNGVELDGRGNPRKN